MTSIVELFRNQFGKENAIINGYNDVTCSIASLIVEFGIRYDQVVLTLLKMPIGTIAINKAVQALLILFVSLVDASNDENACDFSLVRSILARSPEDLRPVVQDLSMMDKFAKFAPILQILVFVLPVATGLEFDMLVRTVLVTVSTERQAEYVFQALRTELTRNHESDCTGRFTSAALVVVSHLQSQGNGELLASSYLNLLRSLKHRIGQDPGDIASIVLFDLPLLLALSRQPDHTASTDNILRYWLRKPAVLFKLFNSLLWILRGRTEERYLYTYLSPALVRCALLLLVSIPSLNIEMPESESFLHIFVLSLHELFDPDRQLELIHGLFNLSHESCANDDGVCESPKSRYKRRLHEPQTEFETLRNVRRLTFSVLKRLAKDRPSSMLPFKHILLRRLESEIARGDSDIPDVCTLIISLVTSNVQRDELLCSSDLLTLLQKLLLTGPVKGNTDRAYRGILLATELLNCDSFEYNECVNAWVIRLLLPSTRRMMEPQLRSPGLHYLQACLLCENDALKDAVFPNLKMILANTGLIQMRSSYQIVDDAILGYSQSLKSESMPSDNTREFLFCVHFFLRHTTDSTNDPTTWRDTMRWVFDLVNIYLQMGRAKSNLWRSSSWLMAAIEFPSVVSILDDSTKIPTEELEWLKVHMSCFDISNRKMQAANLPGDCSHIISRFDSISKERFQDAIHRFYLAILVGVALSAAVLSNAYAHLQNVKNAGHSSYACLQELRRLIKVQLLKVYDLLAKAEMLGIFLFSLSRQIADGNRKDTEVSMISNTTLEQPKFLLEKALTTLASSHRYPTFIQV